MTQLPSRVAARGPKHAERGHTARLLLMLFCAVPANVAVAASDPAPLDSEAQSTEQSGRPVLLFSDSKARKQSPPSTEVGTDESEEDCE